MTNNDLSTLNGSLVEMKDQLIYELGEKGVTASYDSSTGLLGLIGKISEIQTGGSCYHIEFSEDSYTAVGGACTITCTLQQNYSPLANATVTLFDGGGSVYSSITNQDGIATFSLTGLTSSGTYTCSYSNVSDTCTVTVVNYLFYDDCSSDLTSQYANVTINSSSNTIYKSYDTTENAYKLYGSGGDRFRALLIPNIRGEDNIRISIRVKLTNTSAYNQLFIGVSDSITQTSTSFHADMCRIRGDNLSDYLHNGSQEVGGSSVSTNVRNKYVTLVMEKTGTTITMKVYDTDGTTLLRTYTYSSANSYSNPYYWFGLNTNSTSDTKYIKEIIAESI